MRDDRRHRLAEAQLYVRMIASGAPPGALFEVRYRLSQGGMGRAFIPVGEPERAARQIVALGEHTDVYVGCVPRARPRGTRQDLAPARLLWTDCDSPISLHALRAFAPSPSVIVGSGSPGHAHAFWPLTRALALDALQNANRRLACALKADRRCADAPRVLRPAGTFNFKHGARAPVRLLHASARRHDPDELIARLPRETHRQVGQRKTPPPPRRDDPLQRIDPADYVALLTGQTSGRDRKIACPFHEDRTPSLHVYPTPEQGWACYGCPTPDGKPLGGDIYAFASKLWGIPLNGSGFLNLRARLQDVFAIERDRAAPEERSLYRTR